MNHDLTHAVNRKLHPAANDGIVASPSAARPPEDGSPPPRDEQFARVNALLGPIYDGPNDSPPWRAALTALREALGGNHASLALLPKFPQSAGVIFNSDTVRAEGTSAYRTQQFAIDPLAGLCDGGLTRPEDALGADWQESTLYQAFLRPLDVGSLVGAEFEAGDDVRCQLRIARSRLSEAFSPEDHALCRVLLPHLQRAVRFYANLHRIDCERQFYSTAVGRLRLGTIGLSADGRIVELNAEALRILDQRDGLRRVGDALQVDRHLDRMRFESLLARAPDADAESVAERLRGLSIERPSGRGRIAVLIRPNPYAREGRLRSRPAVVVFLRDSEEQIAEVSADVVRRRFGFTPAETALAMCLADGLSLEQATQRLEIPLDAARTCLRRVLSKAGVTRQTLLVRKLLGSVASVG